MSLYDCVRIFIIFCLPLNFYGQNAKQVKLHNVKIEEVVTASLDHDSTVLANKKQKYKVDKLYKNNFDQNDYLEKQSVWLKLSFGSLSFLFATGLFLYYLYQREKRVIESIKLDGGNSSAQIKDLKAAESGTNNISTSGISEGQMINNTDISYLVLSSRSTTQKVNINKLIYVVAENDGTRFYLEDSNFWNASRLKDIAKQLPKHLFIQIFRSTIVNINFINSVKSKCIILENGDELPLSRTYSREVKRVIAEHKK